MASSDQPDQNLRFVPDAGRYGSMPYRRAGKTGLLLSELSLGLWKNFGSDRPIREQRDIILRSFDLGIIHFDLANNYGPPPGAAETVFGAILRNDLAPYRDEIIVSTKAGYRMWPGPYGDWGSRKNLIASLDQSLSRLGLDYVDVYYHHRPDPNTDIEESMSALSSAVSSGKALYVGISNYSPAQTRAAIESARSQGLRLVLHQPSYSMFNRHIEEGLLDVLDENGMGSVVFSPLQQGLLTDRYTDGRIPHESRAAREHGVEAQVSPVFLKRILGLQELARRRGQTLGQLALKWVLRHPAVTSAVIGASTVSQLEQNVAALNSAPLTTDELAAIDEFAVDGTRLEGSAESSS